MRAHQPALNGLKSARKMCEKFYFVLLLVVYGPWFVDMADVIPLRHKTNLTLFRARSNLMPNIIVPQMEEDRPYPFYFYNESLDEAQDKKDSVHKLLLKPTISAKTIIKVAIVIGLVFGVPFFVMSSAILVLKIVMVLKHLSLMPVLMGIFVFFKRLQKIFMSAGVLAASLLPKQYIPIRVPVPIQPTDNIKKNPYADNDDVNIQPYIKPAKRRPVKIASGLGESNESDDIEISDSLEELSNEIPDTPTPFNTNGDGDGEPPRKSTSQEESLANFSEEDKTHIKVLTYGNDMFQTLKKTTSTNYRQPKSK